MYKNILVRMVFDEGHDTQALHLEAKTLASDTAKFTVIHVLEEISACVETEIPVECTCAMHNVKTVARLAY